MHTLTAMILGGVLCLATTGCAQSPTSVETVAMPAATEPADAASCAAAGGAWKGVGMMNVEACVMPYPDAGKVCSDSSECTGDCWADGAVTPEQAGTRATGYCQPTNMPFGCRSQILKGVVQPGLCVD